MKSTEISDKYCISLLLAFIMICVGLYANASNDKTLYVIVSTSNGTNSIEITSDLTMTCKNRAIEFYMSDQSILSIERDDLTLLKYSTFDSNASIPNVESNNDTTLIRLYYNRVEICPIANEELKLISLDGQIVFSKTIKNGENTILDLGNFVSGIYILRVGTISYKIRIY